MKLAPEWWERHFLLYEWLLSVVTSVLFVWWGERRNGLNLIHDLLDQNEPQIYGTLASITGALLGFIVTALSIVLGFSSTERFQPVRESPYYETLWRVFKSSIRGLGFAVGTNIVALISYRDSTAHHLLIYLVGFGLVLSALRVARCIWVLERAVAIVSKPVRLENPKPYE